MEKLNDSMNEMDSHYQLRHQVRFDQINLMNANEWLQDYQEELSPEIDLLPYFEFQSINPSSKIYVLLGEDLNYNPIRYLNKSIDNEIFLRELNFSLAIDIQENSINTSVDNRIRSHLNLEEGDYIMGLSYLWNGISQYPDQLIELNSSFRFSKSLISLSFVDPFVNIEKSIDVIKTDFDIRFNSFGTEINSLEELYQVNYYFELLIIFSYFLIPIILTLIVNISIHIDHLKQSVHSMYKLLEKRGLTSNSSDKFNKSWLYFQTIFIMFIFVMINLNVHFTSMSKLDLHSNASLLILYFTFSIFLNLFLKLKSYSMKKNMRSTILVTVIVTNIILLIVNNLRYFKNFSDLLTQIQIVSILIVIFVYIDKISSFILKWIEKGVLKNNKIKLLNKSFRINLINLSNKHQVRNIFISLMTTIIIIFLIVGSSQISAQLNSYENWGESDYHTPYNPNEIHDWSSSELQEDAISVLYKTSFSPYGLDERYPTGLIDENFFTIMNYYKTSGSINIHQQNQTRISVGISQMISSKYDLSTGDIFTILFSSHPIEVLISFIYSYLTPFYSETEQSFHFVIDYTIANNRVSDLVYSDNGILGILNKQHSVEFIENSYQEYFEAELETYQSSDNFFTMISIVENLLIINIIILIGAYLIYELSSSINQIVSILMKIRIKLLKRGFNPSQLLQMNYLLWFLFLFSILPFSMLGSFLILNKAIFSNLPNDILSTVSIFNLRIIAQTMGLVGIFILTQSWLLLKLKT